MDRMTISIKIVNITTGWQREKDIGNKKRIPVPDFLADTYKRKESILN